MENDNDCPICESENSLRWDKKEITLDDNDGTSLNLTFEFCTECGYTTNVDLS